MTLFNYIPTLYLLNMKLTRKQIKEGLEATPIDTLLLGEPKTLTAKQKKFAEQVALGKTKAEAYRNAYNTKASPQVQAVDAHKLSLNPNISLMIEGLKVGIEAQKYLLPAHLRALTIQKLTEKALDPDVNHAQQIKALELLGKITEVSLFTERKEITQTDSSAKAKDKLIQSLAHAIRSSNNISTAKKKEADQLLEEITGGSLANPQPETIEQASEDSIDQVQLDDDQVFSEAEPKETAKIETPRDADPQNIFNLQVTDIRTIPDKQSATLTDGTVSSETPPLFFTESEWGGVDKFWETFEKVDTENTPLDDLGSHPNPGDIDEKI